MKKIIVIYHGKCPDGFGGAWVAWKKFGNKASYIPANHQEKQLEDLKNKEIYFIDFVYEPAEVVKKLRKQNDKVVVIDHHKTTEKIVKLADDYVFDNNHSGSVLAWRYFYPKKPVPRLLKQIEDFDLWKFKVPGTKATMVYLSVIENNFKIWNKLVKKFESANDRKEIWKKGDCYLELESKLLKQLASERAYSVKIGRQKALAINAPPVFASNLGALLYGDKWPVALVWSQKKNVVKVSLRSNGKVDVGKLAQKYGGGGHKAAASFKMGAGKKLPWKNL